MSRAFYTYAIFFNALSGTLILAQGIIYFLIGSRFMELASTRGWMFILMIITIVSWLIIVAYSHYRNYQFSLWAAVGVIATSVIQAFSFLKVLQTREMTPLFALTTVASILAGIVFGISLLFSKAKERYWLKIAGISFILIGLLGLSTIFLALASVDARLDGTIERLDQWMTMVQCIIPFFFHSQFYQ